MAALTGRIKPYVSLVLARVVRGKGLSGVLDAALTELRADLKMTKSADSKRRFIDQAPESTTGDLVAALLRYRQHHTPAWLIPNSDDAELIDVHHHVLIALRRGRYVAFHCSEPAGQQVIIRRLSEPRGAFKGLESIEPHVLNAAFIDGPAKTLWLTSLGRNVATKADSKVLAGISLQDALDPLADQAYYFTAARVESTFLREPGALRGRSVGAVPQHSRIWAGASRDWEEFARRVSLILRQLEATEAANRSEVAPLPVLAVPTSYSPDVHGAFDVSILPPELFADEPAADEEQRQRMERWSYGANFEILETSGPNFSARLSLDGEPLGDFRFEVRLGPRDRLILHVEPRQQLTGDAALFRDAERICGNRDWVKIRYDSGHTLISGAIFVTRFRDYPFRGWQFADLSGFDVTREKPVGADGRTFAPDQVGKQKSLFCWISTRWPGLDSNSHGSGWLACDDGPGEIADFLHLNLPANAPPLLTLIHVKGSSGRGPKRGVSVSDYEVVSAQAVKNLRFLDRTNLADRFEAGGSGPVGRLVWRDGVMMKNRDGMVKALRSLGANFQRRLVILQPRITQAEHDAVRALQATGKDSPRVARMRQLDTLLLATQGDCRNLDAELVVVGARS